MARITKAELLARIDAVEAECAAHIRKLEEITRERDALLVAQRPSRRVVTESANVTPYRERLAAARELAMRCGTTVKL